MIDPVGGEPRELDQGRQIRFVVTPTGVRVAYAIVGRGPALIVPAAWIGHLEIAWQDPAVRAFYAPIAACRTTRGAHPQAAWREVPRPDRHLVGLRPR
jgi:hypothetical protein